MSDREMLEYSGEVVRTTDAGIAIEMGYDKPIWFPRSQLWEEGDITKESDLGDKGNFFIPEWLAVEKDLE